MVSLGDQYGVSLFIPISSSTPSVAARPVLVATYTLATAGYNQAPVMEFPLPIQELLSLQQAAQIETTELLDGERAHQNLGDPGAQSEIDLGYHTTTTCWPGLPGPFSSDQ